MRTFGCCSVYSSGFPRLRFRRSSRTTLLQPSPRAAGYADLRLAVVSPFVDRRHGSERALAELLERLARDYHCAIHLYAERADDLPLAASKLLDSSESGSIVWHKVPSIRGPHLVKFVGWMFANGFLRWWHR